MNHAGKLALGSLIVGAVVLGIKVLAWHLTGSVALFSDALETVLNLASSGAALFAVMLAARPADQNHTYGHHKAELLSAALIGLLILGAAAMILREAWHGFQTPREIEAPFAGLALSFVATAINAVWATLLIRRGRALRSRALSADGKHLMADVVTSAGVALGIVLAVVTGIAWLDPALALLVALNILWTGWQVMRDALGGLMDAALPEDQMEAIRQAIADNAQGAHEAHDLRVRQAGAATFVDFHLVVPGETTVSDAHDVCDRIEEAIEDAIPGSEVTIHVEPENHREFTGITVTDPDRP
ncbi:cation diffusion facilitator family transporter [Lutimaribacter marinistellae]|uniref:Cation diffusion facilitator family transporter n=1 Tax=Lutimaribacter marinistellae TaxID=1820329 RepID=A0ABV7TAJ3_9RHOB